MKPYIRGIIEMKDMGKDKFGFGLKIELHSYSLQLLKSQGTSVNEILEQVSISKNFPANKPTKDWKRL